MISQRTKGLNYAVLIGQAVTVLIAFAVTSAFSLEFLTGFIPGELYRYTIYACFLLAGLLVESFTRRSTARTSNPLERSKFDQYQLSLRQMVYTILGLLLYVAATKDIYISRTIIGLFLPVLYLSLLWSNRSLPRIIARRFFSGARTERALLIGSEARARGMHRWLCNKAPFGFEAVGILTEDSECDSISGVPRLGSLADIEPIIEEYHVTEAILLGLPEDPAAHEKLVDILDDRGVRILILSDLEEKLRHPIVHFEDDGLSFVTTREEPLENPINRMLKRGLDLAVAAPTVIFIMPPLTIFVWLLQRFASPGPVFYRQVRAGLQNQHFEILKFRTMNVNNPDVAKQATTDDPRVYPGGKWLRRFSIDEIPQFWNVLRGQMSVVGPRPHLAVHNKMFSSQMRKYHIRALVKPGMTGLAQLRGFRGEVRSVEDIRSRLESDIAYMENWRLGQDVVIIFRTFLQIFFLLANSLLLKRRKADTLPAGSEVAYTRGENLGGVLVAGYEPRRLRRNYRTILGIRFFTGSAVEAVALSMQGGLMVAPSAPVLIGMADQPVQRAAVVSSDLAITDSGLMVILWHLVTGERITRVSGLEFLDLLLQQPQLHKPGSTFWIMPSEESMRLNLKWMQAQGMQITEDDCYIAPNYQHEKNQIVDPAQVEAIQRRRPQFIVIAIGGGVQERLGAELRRSLDYRPAIYCLGAAIGFLSGDQAHIPRWADRARLGWLFRCLNEPRKFIPRYWDARKLLGLMLEHQGRLPVSESGTPTAQKPA